DLAGPADAAAVPVPVRAAIARAIGSTIAIQAPVTPIATQTPVAIAPIAIQAPKA
ncbi:hypothetical protein N332_06041, partial [Mesitornis unicolor]